MIAIVNVSTHNSPIGWHEYELRINAKVIARFRHKREEGLTKCLERAAEAAEKAKWMEAKAMIDALSSNVELTGAAAGLSPQRPATEGSEVERRVGPLDGKCGFCGAVAHAGEEWGYTKDLAQQWVLSCPRCCSEAGGAVREIAANGLPGASKW